MSGRFGMVPARAFDDKRMTDSLIAVLGLVATYGNRDGWYGMRLREMAERRGVTKQSISGAIGKLIGFGYIESRPTTRADGGRGWNEYRVMHDVDLPRQHQRVPPSNPEVDGVSNPEVDAIQTPGTELISKAKAFGNGVATRPEEPLHTRLFAAVAEVWTGQPWPIALSDKNRGYIASALPDLISLDTTPEEVHRRGAIYAQHYDGKRPTPQALVKHWPSLDRPPAVPMRGTNRSLENGARWIASKEGSR